MPTSSTPGSGASGMMASVRDTPFPTPGADSGPALQRITGAASVGFVHAAPETRLDTLFQSGCSRILFPRSHGPGPFEAVVVNTAGGLTGGDTVTLGVTVGRDAAAMVSGQAAEKIYRALAGEVEIDTRLELHANGFLAWLPQEAILFDGARLKRRLTVELAGNSRLLAVESTVFGRTHRGESFGRGFYRDDWRIGRDGRLIWADAQRLSGDIEALFRRRAGFAGNRASSTIVYAAEDAQRWLDPAREIIAGCAGRVGVTAFAGVLLIRLLAADGFALRQSTMRILTRLWSRIAGAVMPLPRVWSC